MFGCSQVAEMVEAIERGGDSVDVLERKAEEPFRLKTLFATSPASA